MDITERQRRHDELFQKEVVDGLSRILDVLHDISDGIRDLHHAADRAPMPAPPTAPEGPALLSVKDLAAELGITTSAVHNLRYSGQAPVVTKLGGRVYFQRVDVDDWLLRQREIPEDNTRPWRESFTPGRIGATLPRSSDPPKREWCSGSHTEPMAAAKYVGRGVCRVCKDDVLVNRDGRLRKHYPRWW